MAAILKHHTAQIIPLNRTLVQNAANGRKEPILLDAAPRTNGGFCNPIEIQMSSKVYSDIRDHPQQYAERICNIRSALRCQIVQANECPVDQMNERWITLPDVCE